MKYLIHIIGVFLFIPFLGLSQSKISIGGNLNAAISSLEFTNSNIEKGKAYSIGVHAQFAILENIFLRSGLNIKKNNYEYIRNLRWPSGDISVTQNELVITSIGLPIDVVYKIKSKNSKINFLLGMSGVPSLNTDSASSVQGLGETLESQNRINKLSSSLGVFGGVEIRIKEELTLGIEPNLRYGSIYPSLFSKSRIVESGITLRIRT